jgi:excinuclease ABC subunit A
MRAADHIVDLGPGAGEHGGAVVFEGDYAGLIAPSNTSLTGRYLRGELKVSHRKVPPPHHSQRLAEILRRTHAQPQRAST